jgi:hypothetical protein
MTPSDANDTNDSSDEAVLLQELLRLMAAYAADHPHPNDRLKGFGMGFAYVLAHLIRETMLPPAEMDHMFEQTFANIRRVALDLVAHDDRGEPGV